MENNLVCRICGSKLSTLHHPACPIGQAQENKELQDLEPDIVGQDELFVVDNQILNFITNAVAIAGQEYARYKEEQVDEKIGVERWEQYRKDYFEMSDFAQAMVNIGFMLSADDVVYFLKNPQKYQQYYMIWLELSRPVNVTDETFGLFNREVWERKQVGKQTKNTGD
tara:strand:+ start:6248 stop:6751 length:504 start_codon:yes stop_codon:yes gene_type:complete